MGEELFAGFDLKEWEDIGFVKCLDDDGKPFKIELTARDHKFSIDIDGDVYLREAAEYTGVGFKGATPFFVKQLIERLDED